MNREEKGKGKREYAYYNLILALHFKFVRLQLSINAFEMPVFPSIITYLNLA